MSRTSRRAARSSARSPTCHPNDSSASPAIARAICTRSACSCTNCCGKLPFSHESDDLVAVMFSHVNDRPKPPRQINPLVPAALDRIIMRLLEKIRRAVILMPLAHRRPEGRPQRCSRCYKAGRTGERRCEERTGRDGCAHSGRAAADCRGGSTRCHRTAEAERQPADI